MCGRSAITSRRPSAFTGSIRRNESGVSAYSRMMPMVERDARPRRDAEFVRTGDIDGLVDRHYASVYAVALRMLGDAGEARDAAQETFLRAMAGLATYDASRPFAAWILSITANLIRDRFR